MKIDIGLQLKDTINLERGTNRMVASGSINMTYNLTVEGIKYKICKDKNSIIDYIETNDTNFLTPDGFKVGMSLNNPKIVSLKNDLRLENGWAYVLPLKSGWNAAFTLINYDLGIMSQDSTINFFFKRK